MVDFLGSEESDYDESDDSWLRSPYDKRLRHARLCLVVTRHKHTRRLALTPEAVGCVHGYERGSLLTFAEIFERVMTTVDGDSKEAEPVYCLITGTLQGVLVREPVGNFWYKRGVWDTTTLPEELRFSEVTVDVNSGRLLPGPKK